MPRSIIEVRQNPAALYYFVLSVPRRASLLTSPAYRTREAAEVAINALRSAARFNNMYQRLTSSRMEWYFTVWSQTGDVLGTSLMFPTKVEREQAIRSVKRWAPYADTVEEGVAGMDGSGRDNATASPLLPHRCSSDL